MRLAKTDEVHEARKHFAELAYEKYGSPINREQLEAFCAEHGFKWPSWLVKGHEFRAGRGVYHLPVEGFQAKEVSKPAPTKAEKLSVSEVSEVSSSEVQNYAGTNLDENNVPDRDPLYVKFGQYDLVHKVVSSQKYYPLFVTGLSGNGKTFMIEQACASAKRNLYRVNITVETDEDDLLGGFRLIDGETVWFNGPVVKAMLTGSVLLLDEIDLASSKILCLQPVLEGKGVFLKKINKFVKPAPGFTVLATANTKGKGSDDGRFIGTNVLNEAFLERFPVTIEQEYPAIGVETRILKRVLKSHGIEDDETSKKLVQWADSIRDAFYDGAVDEIISTRRLVHIINAFVIVDNINEAIELCINRFDTKTKEAFLQLWGMFNLSPEELEKKQQEEAAKAAAEAAEDSEDEVLF